MLKLGLALVLVAGCTTPDIYDAVHHAGPSARLYDDGTSLRITGCPDAELLGCNPPAPADAMQATVGGAVLDVPATTDGQIDDQLLGLFSDGPFQLTTGVPANGAVGLSLAGETASVELPPGFAVDAPTGPVSRGAGPITITYGVLPGGTMTALIWTTCGATTHVDEVVEAAPGKVALDLAAQAPGETGPCTHVVHLDQTVSPPAGGIAVSMIRIEALALDSTP